MKRSILVVLAIVAGGLSSACAQETIFNIPNGDILDKGKIYGEFDFRYFGNASVGIYTPGLGSESK